MNKFLFYTVSIAFFTLIGPGNKEAMAQTDTQFLNTYANDTRKSLPQTINNLEFTDAQSSCPSGCANTSSYHNLAIISRTPQFTKQNISIAALEQSVKPQMLQTYCGSDASRRNIPVYVHIYDMYRIYVGAFTVSASECPGKTTSNQSTPSLQATSQDAQFLNSLAADARKSLPATIGNIEITDATSYCPGGCQQNFATNFIGFTGRTPRLTRQNVSIGQLEQTEKAGMVKDYCTSPAKQRNVNVAIYIYDMYKNYIGVFQLAPSDCANQGIASNQTANNSGTSAEDQFWNAVNNSSRIADFQAYLNSYPNGKYSALATLRINQLSGTANSSSAANNSPAYGSASSVEQQYWDAVKNSNRLSDFQDYLNSYPNGQYAAVARLRINQLGGSISSTASSPGFNNPSYGPPSASANVEQQYWDAIKNSTRPEDFQSYLRDYPNGQFVPIARLKMSQLGSNVAMNPSNATAEDQYWSNISNSQRAQDFQGYLYNYPNGTYSALARLRISQLGGYMAPTTPAVSAVEEQYWNNVKYSQRAQDFQNYLNSYPNGQYSMIARLRINQLTSLPYANTGTNYIPQPQTLADVLATAEYGSLNEISTLRRVYITATDLDSRDTIIRELSTLQKLVVVSRKEDAEFFVIFALTDQATGNNVVSNSNPVNQTNLGEMLVFSVRPGANGVAVPRILWRTKKNQVFTNGLSFNRPPAVNAARDLVKELRKLNF